MAIDVEQLLQEMKEAVSKILGRDVAEGRGFSERQLKALAQQAFLVEAGILSGQITEDTQDFLLDGLEDMTLNFAETLRGLKTVTIEKVWNAVVGVLWKAIETGTGLVLPTPDIEPNG